MFGEKPGLQPVLKRIVLRMNGLEEESEHRFRFCLPIIRHGRGCAALSASLGGHVASLERRLVAAIQNIFVWFLPPSLVTARYTDQKCYPMQTSKRSCACLHVPKLNYICCHQERKVPWIPVPCTSFCFSLYGGDWFVKTKLYHYLFCIQKTRHYPATADFLFILLYCKMDFPYIVNEYLLADKTPSLEMKTFVVVVEFWLCHLRL